jgi:hypothetical protein
MWVISMLNSFSDFWLQQFQTNHRNCIDCSMSSPWHSCWPGVIFQKTDVLVSLTVSRWGCLFFFWLFLHPSGMNGSPWQTWFCLPWQVILLNNTNCRWRFSWRPGAFPPVMYLRILQLDIKYSSITLALTLRRFRCRTWSIWHYSTVNLGWFNLPNIHVNSWNMVHYQCLHL